MNPADEFLKIANQFQLGSLDTEAQHPLTLGLSEWAREDLPRALRAIQAVDVLALRRFEDRSHELPALAEAIQRTLADGRRIFFCGCGATGRLSLSLELFCRQGLLPPEMADRAVGFMAGGDLALIKAIETFEDHPEYGARQLDELGFRDGDLLLSSTEGGETPFVIGATERAADVSRNRPWFQYCNPDDKLCAVAERSRRVIENPKIRKLPLVLGPMALSGSTRMQASTVLMASIGFALLHRLQPAKAAEEVRRFREFVEQFDFTFLVPFIEKEAAIYEAGEFVLYEPGPYGITVLTDTTERSPTFTLLPFENQNQPEAKASWCHLHLPGEPSAASAWRALLLREPRTLEWPEVRHLAGKELLAGYNFSGELPALRRQRTGARRHFQFSIRDSGAALVLDFAGLRHAVALPPEWPFFHRHLLLKLILNSHSTLIMGRLGRYLDNLMTFVKPSNYKLIDRAIRYVQQLIQRRSGTAPAYEVVCRQLFAEIPRLQPNEPIVIRTMNALM